MILTRALMAAAFVAVLALGLLGWLWLAERLAGVVATRRGVRARRTVLAWLFFAPASYVTVAHLGWGDGGAVFWLVAYLALLAVVLALRFQSGAWRRRTPNQMHTASAITLTTALGRISGLRYRNATRCRPAGTTIP